MFYARIKEYYQTKEERIAPDDLYEMAKERFSVKEIMVSIFIH